MHAEAYKAVRVPSLTSRVFYALQRYKVIQCLEQQSLIPD